MNVIGAISVRARACGRDLCMYARTHKKEALRMLAGMHVRVRVRVCTNACMCVCVHALQAVSKGLLDRRGWAASISQSADFSVTGEWSTKLALARAAAYRQ